MGCSSKFPPLCNVFRVTLKSSTCICEGLKLKVIEPSVDIETPNIYVAILGRTPVDTAARFKTNHGSHDNRESRAINKAACSFLLP